MQTPSVAASSSVVPKQKRPRLSEEPAPSDAGHPRPARLGERAEDPGYYYLLPSVLLDLVLGYLPARDLMNACMASKAWRGLSSRDEPWRAVILRAWPSLAAVVAVIDDESGRETSSWSLKDFCLRRVKADRSPTGGRFTPRFLQCELRQQSTLASLGSLTLPLNDPSLISKAFGDSMVIPGLSFIGVPSDISHFEDLEGCDLELTLIDVQQRVIRSARINKGYQTFLSPVPCPGTDGMMLVQLRSWRHAGSFGWLTESTRRAATTLEPVVNVVWQPEHADDEGGLSWPGRILQVALRIEIWHTILGDAVPLDNMHPCDTLRLIDRMIEAAY